MLAVGTTFFVLGGLTYVVPGLELFQPWVPGDRLPFASFFGAGTATDLPQFAGAMPC